MKVRNLCVIFVFLLSGCKSCPGDKEFGETDKSLKINIQGDPASLNPHLGIDLNCGSLQKAIFEGLYRFSPQGKSEPALAKETILSESQTTYTFKLRQAYWSNDQEIRAIDFERAWKKAIAKDSNCLHADLFYPIKNAKKIKKGELPLENFGVKALDDKTLVVELEHPTPYFLESLAHPLYSPLYDDDEEPKIFNGPFLVSSWKHGKNLILKRNPTYWDVEHVKLASISISLVNDPNTALLMFEKGELDWAGCPFTILPPESLIQFEKENKLISQPVTGVFWLCCNTEKFPLNSCNIRKALALSLNRNEIANHVAFGQTPLFSLVPLNMLVLNDQELSQDSDYQSAKSFFLEGLKELGLEETNFPKLTVSHSDIPGQKKLAEVVADEWKKNLGIEVELAGQQWNTFVSDLSSGHYQIGGCVWHSVYNDPIYYLEFFKEKDHPYNSSHWENSDYKNLLEEADRQIDPLLRKEILKKAELILLEEMPVIPLYISHHKYLLRDTVEGVYVSPMGFVDFKWSSIR